MNASSVLRLKKLIEAALKESFRTLSTGNCSRCCCLGLDGGLGRGDFESDEASRLVVRARPDPQEGEQSDHFEADLLLVEQLGQGRY
ncbi:hypothetical protein, partial [Pseudomonas protegens]|uniref:hypothetical protein n=1 Tax=Pseudomonas protegens TaxID=380021 RepID=UPI001C8312F7